MLNLVRFCKKTLKTILNIQFFKKKTIEEQKYNKINKIILRDKNLIKIGIQDTVRQIVKNYTHCYPCDFIFREIASFIVNIGHAYYARPYFKYSLKYNNSPLTYSLYLQGLLIDPFVSDKDIYKEAIKYNKYYSHIKRFKKYTNKRDPNKKIKIAYLCHFFFNSVSQSLLVPFVRSHNRDRVQIYCYSDADPKDITEDMKKIADVWRDTKHLDDDTLAALIRTDEIDILLELNGHVLSNRYGVVARKPAPIQINYYNQSATTGLKTLDYVLVGEDIHLQQKNYMETIHKIKGVQGVAIFPDTFPAVASMPPCFSKGYITFGSFGAAHKVNTEVVKLWCQILKAVPNAKLFMKAGVLTFEPYLKVYQKLFREGGIELDRIRFEGFSDHYTMLTCYANVDIALDTHPHNAGTTTMEAMWQGVPVITLCGSQRYCSQNGRIVLTAVGHPELVAYTEEQYIAKAVTLAKDKKQLQLYRNQLRNDFKNSTLANAADFVKRLEDVYVELWKRYCK